MRLVLNQWWYAKIICPGRYLVWWQDLCSDCIVFPNGHINQLIGWEVMRDALISMGNIFIAAFSFSRDTGTSFKSMSLNVGIMAWSGQNNLIWMKYSNAIFSRIFEAYYTIRVVNHFSWHVCGAGVDVKVLPVGKDLGSISKVGWCSCAV